MLFISVIGGSKPSKEAYKLAEEVGGEIAKSGATLVCGGLYGCMEAACKGAKRFGGLTIGILPGSKRENANRWVDVPIITGIGYARNKLVVKSGHVCIAVDGSYGTLSEIGFALGYEIPVVGLKTWTFISHGGKPDKKMKIAETPKQAVEIAMKIAKKIAKKEERNKKRKR